MQKFQTGIKNQSIQSTLFDRSRCISKELCAEAYLHQQAKVLRAELDADRTPTAKEIIASEVGEKIRQKVWYQRIYLPIYKISTTSHLTDTKSRNPGRLNTLNNIFSYDEAFVLRPLPKWIYLKPILPEVSGLSVLEVGCASGFFSFKFAEMGASRVLGIDIIPSLLDGAEFARNLLGFGNVQFQLTNILTDTGIEPHDIVFMSEVYPHFISPFQGILRCINLARKILVIDANITVDPSASMRLFVEQNDQTGHIAYSSWSIPESLLLNFFWLTGIEPQRITRYVSPIPNHMVYLIDTSDIKRIRDIPGRYHSAMQIMLNEDSLISRS